MRPDDITDEECVLRVLDAPDDEVGPACMNVRCPPTTATDDDFREAYCQGYRHALADVRDAVALRDERVRADERKRFAREVRSYVTDGKLIGSRAAVVVAYVERAIREGGQFTEFVLADRLAEVERERDALRARVEELEAALGRVIDVIDGHEVDLSHCPYRRGTGTCVDGCSVEPECGVGEPSRGWPIEAARALLSGGSREEPRSAICECCEQPTTRPYVHPVEGIDLCAPCVAEMPREEPRPDTSETCPTCGGRGRLGVTTNVGPCPSCGGSGRPNTTEEDRER